MAKRKNKSFNRKENHVADEQPQVPVTEAAQIPQEEITGLPPQRIADPESVFCLAMLDERRARITMERTLKINLLDTKMLQLQEERKNMIRQLGREESETTSELERVRAIISQKHGIDLSLYGYDDATGTLNFLGVQAQ